MEWYRVCKGGTLNKKINMAKGLKPNWFTDLAGSQAYRKHFESQEGMYIVHITGNLKLLSVAKLVQKYNFKPTGFNILDENLERIVSEEENILDENKYYDQLHKFMNEKDPEFIENYDGYYTPATESFHVEMVLFSEEIINAVNNASNVSASGTPLKNRPFSVRYGDDEIKGTVKPLIQKFSRKQKKSRQNNLGDKRTRRTLRF